MELRYGTNPQQRARVEAIDGGGLPARVVHGSPSYVNMLDALNAWQLVWQAAGALGHVAAASFKHVSPAGVAVAPTPTGAYARARDTDPKSSYGDVVAVSAPVDRDLAEVLRTVVSDAIVAPGFDPDVVPLLAAKKGGRFLVLEADPTFVPPSEEARDVFGARLVQSRDQTPISRELLVGAPEWALDDLVLGLLVLRFTQSNSVSYLRHGATLGVAAGQQSRVDGTRLAGAKADTWWLRQHRIVRSLRFRRGVPRQDRINWQTRFVDDDLSPAERARFEHALEGPPPEFGVTERRAWLERLDDVVFVSDGAIPFRDNIDHAARHGVRVIAEPGGMRRTADVDAACAEHGIAIVRTGVRLFHH
jgi:phosphoribosylaminoimidazolecarboxamide formyltransferase/IMP cyclohydrolase